MSLESWVRSQESGVRSIHRHMCLTHVSHDSLCICKASIPRACVFYALTHTRTHMCVSMCDVTIHLRGGSVDTKYSQAPVTHSVRDKTYLHVWQDSVNCVTWLICTCVMTHSRVWTDCFRRRSVGNNAWYRVATISRLLQIIGLFCKRALSKRRYSAKETYNFKRPTNFSHPITTALNMRDMTDATENATLKIHQIDKLRFLGISRYKFRLRFWFSL